jgi:hypothetical protein
MGGAASSMSTESVYEQMAEVTLTNVNKSATYSNVNQTLEIDIGKGCDFTHNNISMEQIAKINIDNLNSNENMQDLKNEIEKALQASAKARAEFLSGVSVSDTVINDITRIKNSVTNTIFQDCQLVSQLNQNLKINLGGPGTGVCNFSDNTINMKQVKEAIMKCYQANQNIVNAVNTLVSHVEGTSSAESKSIAGIIGEIFTNPVGIGTCIFCIICIIIIFIGVKKMSGGARKHIVHKL